MAFGSWGHCICLSCNAGPCLGQMLLTPTVWNTRSPSLDKCRNPPPSRSMIISFSDCAHASFPAFELAAPTKRISMHVQIDNDENTRTEHWTLKTSVEEFLIRFLNTVRNCTMLAVICLDSGYSCSDSHHIILPVMSVEPC